MKTLAPRALARIRQSESAFQSVFKRYTSDAPDLRLQDCFRLIFSFEKLSRGLYLARKKIPSTDPLRKELEDGLSQAAFSIISVQKAAPQKHRGYRAFCNRYGKLWRENFTLFAFAVLLFVVAILSSAGAVTNDPSLASAFLPRSLMGKIVEHERWFDEILKNPAMAGMQIAYNNIRVSVLCFVSGIFLGIGPVYFLLLNGFLLGAMFAFCRIHQFHDALMSFVVGHGVLELTIIIASAFAGFLMGRVFFMRPYRGFFQRRMKESVIHAGTIAWGVIPWLLLAALVESGISPQPEIPIRTRIGLGIFVALLFWLWTFSKTWKGASSDGEKPETG